MANIKRSVIFEKLRSGNGLDLPKNDFNIASIRTLVGGFNSATGEKFSVKEVGENIVIFKKDDPESKAEEVYLEAANKLLYYGRSVQSLHDILPKTIEEAEAEERKNNTESYQASLMGQLDQNDIRHLPYDQQPEKGTDIPVDDWTNNDDPDIDWENMDLIKKPIVKEEEEE